MLCVTTQTTKQETCVNTTIKWQLLLTESAFINLNFSPNSALDEGVWTSEDIL